MHTRGKLLEEKSELVYNIAMNQVFVNITEWIPLEEAKTKLKQYIEDGVYKESEIKKGSCKFTNGKDKTDGYICRLKAISGIHPELELDEPKKIVHKRPSGSDFVAISDWIPVEEAKKRIHEYILSGEYKEGEITYSSAVFKNRKDKSDGYVCRIKAKKLQTNEEVDNKKTLKVINKENSSEDNIRYVIDIFEVKNKENSFCCLVEENKKFKIDIVDVDGMKQTRNTLHTFTDGQEAYHRFKFIQCTMGKRK